MVKPLFSDKEHSTDRITLKEGSDIIDDSTEVAETLNNFFSNAVDRLNVEIDKNLIDTENINYAMDPTFQAIVKFKGHPSILKIKNVFNNGDLFSFTPVTYEEVQGEIRKFKERY